ncbi:hypothetical protein [Mycobacterium sp.]|uniref:hypothetical protein n=1 Tax=Mycobacterium sp. TaxID=1785 RepID=UPI003D111722
MTVREILPRAEVVVDVVGENAALAAAIEDIGKKTNIPEKMLKQHLGEAILEALDKIGAYYVAELGDAVRHLEVLRDHVHDFYERVLDGLDRDPDTGYLASVFRELHDLLVEISDPQLWANRRTEQPGGVEQFAAEMRSAPESVTRQGVPTWGTRPVVDRRVWTLPAGQRDPVLAARRACPDLTARALAGDSSALSTLIDALRADGVDQATLHAVSAGVAAVRDPGLEFALGGHPGVGDSGFRGAAAKRLDQLPNSQRAAIANAAAADPDFVRAAVTSHSGFGDPNAGPLDPVRPTEMAEFCRRNGIGEAERAQLETGLRELNQAFRGGEPSWVDAPSTSDDPLTESAAMRRDILDRGADALGLPRGGRIAQEMARAMVSLRRYASPSHEQFLDLAYDWLRYAENTHGRPTTLRRYIQARMRTHVRGMVGEFSAAFQLGPDFWVLKGPDYNVTVPGTDFVVVSKRSGEIWFCDNKALSDNSLGRVSSLVENIEHNMAADLAEFGELSQSPFAMPDNVSAALDNAQRAAEAIRAAVDGKDTADPDVQAEFTRICDENGVRRVVTNAGGQLSELSSALTALGIDLANLDGATALPERPLKHGE